MPELPEVEFGRRLAERVACGRRIERVRCADDRLVFDGVRPGEVARRLRRRIVLSARRHGKHLWFELDERPWPLFHFGMTGHLRTRGEPALALETGVAAGDTTWPPRFAKIHLWFDDGGELVMTNARRLGRIRLRDDPLREPPVAGLGFDPLHGLPDLRTFRELLSRRPRSALKALLLDQGFAAGVGNWMADEILFQAALDPRRKAGGLAAAEVRALRGAIGRVARTAVAAEARKERFPPNWLFHARWEHVRPATLADGTPVARLRVAGRTTAWVPSRQR